MHVLVKKLNAAPWKILGAVRVEDIPADRFGSCLKTKGNTLSVWRCQENSLDEAVLAIVAANDYLDTFDIVVFSEDELGEAGLDVRETRGETPIDDLADTHRDIVDMTYSSLGAIGRLIVAKFAHEDTIGSRVSVRRYSKGQLKKIVLSAISENRLDRKDLAYAHKLT